MSSVIVDSSLFLSLFKVYSSWQLFSKSSFLHCLRLVFSVLPTSNSSATWLSFSCRPLETTLSFEYLLSREEISVIVFLSCSFNRSMHWSLMLIYRVRNSRSYSQSHYWRISVLSTGWWIGGLLARPGELEGRQLLINTLGPGVRCLVLE